MSSPSPPVVSFFRFIPECRPPQRADRSAAGTLPTRAYRFCEAVCTASAFGWYLFPPLRFRLLWTGTEVLWSYRDTRDWYMLDAAQFPNFADHFDSVAPERLRSFAPPFLAAIKEQGVVQVWSGLVARTASGWSLLVRAPVNLQRGGGYEVFEGIVETDRWFGPLFTNLRLTRTDVPIEFDPDFPFLQVQPLHRTVYADATSGAFAIEPGMERVRPEDWDAFYEVVARPSACPARRLGGYAAAVRQRRRHEEPEAAPWH